MATFALASAVIQCPIFLHIFVLLISMNHFETHLALWELERRTLALREGRRQRGMNSDHQDPGSRQGTTWST